MALIVARPSNAASSLLGYLYMAGAVASWVAYTFAARKVALRYGRVSVTFWQSLFGLIGCLPFALMEHRAWRTPSTVVVLNVLYLGLLCSAAGYWLYVATVEHLGVGKASVFINLIPVVAVVAAFFILGDHLGWLQLAGGIHGADRRLPRDRVMGRASRAHRSFAGTDPGWRPSRQGRGSACRCLRSTRR